MKKSLLMIPAFILAFSFLQPASAFSLGDAVKIGDGMLKQKQQEDQKKKQEAERQQKAELNEAKKYADRILKDYNAIKAHQEIRLRDDILQAHSDLQYSYSQTNPDAIRQNARSLSNLLPAYQARLKEVEKEKQAAYERKREEKRIAAQKAEKARAEKQAAEQAQREHERALQKEQAKLDQQQKERETTEKKKRAEQAEAHRIANLSENDKLGEEVLNYTTFGSKQAHAESWKMIDPQHCIFKRESQGGQAHLKLNNVILDSIKIGSSYNRFYKKPCHVVKLVGDNPVIEFIYDSRRSTKLSLDFEDEGEIYSSLSIIAKLITGSHWSGPRFFGLNKRPTPPRVRS
ncbi:exported hypothetical protein [Candidatus Terasakiella magnetica]|uniref:Uncharacterized protein n=1 Tax=Candidatus Terasakiella magnetica TaxID=1867952 RepID=A0A1C3RI61_9PROT|nr:DUF2924 domain-containing protein [Candidatus Terasakiella magnetica]SCA56971.1 exported hypothetical protein [Candidatus Terasakiella magnetica]